MADILRVSILGTLPGGEVWSVNPCYRLDGGGTLNYSEALAAVAAVNAIAVPTGLRAMMNSGTAVTGCRVESRSYGGALESQADGLKATPTFGTGAGSLPYQSAAVLSLRTVAAGGKGRGRLYWPATGLQLAPATLRMTTAVRDAFATDFKNYLTAIQSAIDGVIDESLILAVWSRTNGSSSGVAKIMAGDVVDTQRRRRDAIPESYTEVTYASAAALESGRA